MGLAQRLAVLTPADYLRIERAAAYRSEYFAGEMFAMPGGSPRHSLIKTNVVSELRGRLKGRPCTAYDSDLRIRIAASGLYTYADASVICGELSWTSRTGIPSSIRPSLPKSCPTALKLTTAARNSTITANCRR
jgi:Uma2 family endonuclease